MNEPPASKTRCSKRNNLSIANPNQILAALKVLEMRPTQHPTIHCDGHFDTDHRVIINWGVFWEVTAHSPVHDPRFKHHKHSLVNSTPPSYR